MWGKKNTPLAEQFKKGPYLCLRE